MEQGESVHAGDQSPIRRNNKQCPEMAGWWFFLSPGQSRKTNNAVWKSGSLVWCAGERFFADQHQHGERKGCGTVWPGELCFFSKAGTDSGPALRQGKTGTTNTG